MRGKGRVAPFYRHQARSPEGQPPGLTGAHPTCVPSADALPNGHGAPALFLDPALPRGPGWQLEAATAGEKELYTYILHSRLCINTLVLKLNFGIAFFFPDVILSDHSTGDITQCTNRVRQILKLMKPHFLLAPCSDLRAPRDSWRFLIYGSTLKPA